VDRQVPESEGGLAAALARVDRELASGKNVVLHCRQGIGRTGLVAACLLLTKGLDPKAAVQRLSSARGLAVPETTEQREWIDRFAAGAVVLR
jgi:protein-tyrosine phosphatase